MIRLRCTVTDPTGRVHTSPPITRPYTHAVLGRHCYLRAIENAHAPYHAHLDGDDRQPLIERLAFLNRSKAAGFFDGWHVLAWVTRPPLIARLEAQALGIFGEALVLTATQEAA